MVDETRSASLPAAGMPYPPTTTTTTTAGSDPSSKLQAIPREDTPRSTSLPTPAASSVSSETRSISTTASSSIGGGTDQHNHHRPPTSSHGLTPKSKHKNSLSGRSLRNAIPSITLNDANSRPTTSSGSSLRPGSAAAARRPGSSSATTRPGTASPSSSRRSDRKWSGLKTKMSLDLDRRPRTSHSSPPSPPPPVPSLDRVRTPFNPISLDIPTGSLEELGPQAMRFSKRGSLIKDGGKMLQTQSRPPQERQVEGRREVQSTGSRKSQETPQVRSQDSPDPKPRESQEPEERQQPQKKLEQPQQSKEPTKSEQPEQSGQPEQSEKPQSEQLQASRSESQQENKQQDVLPVPTTPTDQIDPLQSQVQAQPRRLKPSASLRVRQVSLPSRAISADEDMLSRRVRLMYEKGEENVSDSEVANSMTMENSILWEEASADAAPPGSAGTGSKRISTLAPDRMPMMKRETNELAGGIEYWKNIAAGDVDRYGFIRNTTNSQNGAEPNPIQRVSTSLLLASETPRRKHSIRPPSTRASNRSFTTGRSPTRKFSEPSIRPSSSQSTYSTPVKRSGSRFRHAANHLPHNRDRRLQDEAADMLSLPVEALDSSNRIDSATARTMKKKEWEREDKWTKMAKPIKKANHGGGMTFEFDTQSSKLIERTWKGIPDRWRSTAWYSFLESSARKRSDSPSEDELIKVYHEFQFISSPDDVQIDIDVPRTITSHIMFRRRYRGGQRLLFRVLHAMSLYFPDTGYVQGMAALAATLLAYYDEEHAFIMLVRLWQLRGLERLYESGFAGLMEALDDFERDWLAGGEVAIKLNDLGIPPTAYGTRWYLTLFNYSIPFPAQLRVWDVFMLLGDADLSTPSPSIIHFGKSSVSSSHRAQQSQAGEPPQSQGQQQGLPEGKGFGRNLDVLHATSAALIDGMREIILESDFENAMKVLTSWVPIKDFEVFMRVAKAEWKVHRKKG